ncbi:carboxymuconolactone decarboxylase family protein [Mucilaginibacter lacusdianchii]|uniref:carboxymuconolactone decarboxylase family protein n=1 Tax=Mucilaginibacter lacusdianchii TaxID=2684211 RepID=UPI00131C48CD|nr:carboxymuconolactone decarboxylase family protein [Mucilaginibacter sp. JXJ CY 39]
METRININQVDPEAYKAMMTLETYVHKSGLNRNHYELIKIRASQINGCAFCLDMHTKDARKLGESEQRIYLLNAWHETTLFTETERAILSLTEEITKIQNGVSAETYSNAVKVLGENTTAQVIMAAVTINAWNRIAITTQLQPALA